jgi:hypothetical protein
MAENTTVVTELVHGGGNMSDEYSELWPPEAPQQRRYHYALYEEAVELEVDLDTGRWRYVSFAGLPINDTEWHG